jgi:hypothetical protein
MLAELQLTPGIFTNATDRTAFNRWKDCDHVRWKDSLPEKIGGWTYHALSGAQTVTYNIGDTTTPNMVAGNAGQIIGVARAIHDWIAIDGTKWIAVGTQFKLYLIANFVLYDITPILSSGTLTNPFTTTLGSPVITVAHTTHGMNPNDFVNFSGATAVGGITVNGNYQIATVPNPNTYTIQAVTNATSSATGGGTVTYQYEIHAGTDGLASTSGWGISTWNTMPGWNQPRPVNYDTPTQILEARIWSLDNWGENLMACGRGTQVYTWIKANGVGTRAVVIANSPQTNNYILVAQQERILIGFGSYDGVVSDQMNIRWSDQEDYTDWTPTFNNRSGSNRLTAGSRIISAVSTQTQIVVFTDGALYSMTFIGGNDVYSFSIIGENITIGGPNAASEINGTVYFMSAQEFWVFDGVVRILPCDVRETIFGGGPKSVNLLRLENTYCFMNPQFNEVWWLYTSQASLQNDRYVVYNYKENCWYYGSIDRTCMHAYSPLFRSPYGVRSDGFFFTHEDAQDDVDSSGNPLALNSFVASYDGEIGHGDQFYHVNRLIPDFPRLIGNGTVTLNSHRYPDDNNLQQKGPYTVTPTSDKISVRTRNRQISLRFDQQGLGTDFRMGHWRVDATPHGRR